MMRPFLLCMTALACATTCPAAQSSANLEQGFLHPPDAARPWVYWFVMDGNLGREGITPDLEALKRVGIGGVLFMEVDVGIPKGPVKFMSDEWRGLFKYANEEAARLNLKMTMPASPGWTGSGGPWIKPEQSMQKLVFAETNIEGPMAFEGQLPQPTTVAGFYRDVAVLAYPTPSKKFRIPDIEEKAIYRRGHYSSEPGVKALLPSSATYPLPSPDQRVALDAIIDLTRHLDSSGRLRWAAPAGNWTVLRFGHTSTGANTRPAPAPGLGLECDKLDREALKSHFDDFLGRLLIELGPLAGKSLVSLHIDSWEMGTQNWTARFPAEFRKRRGYALTRYLPVMTGQIVENREVSERFLWDLRETILELIAENHAGYLAELAHQRGIGLSIEPYDGTPCDDMTYGSRADVPMGEFWRDTFDTWFSCTEASSIAHTHGKPVVQAEAFTSGDGERWQAYPGALKSLGDWAFCEGINRFVMHRYAHQPWLDRWPGMTMGIYGIHYERTQTWFEQSKAWIDYLSRCEYLLQQGLFVADICYLSPEGSPQVFRQPKSATAGTPPERLGYNFDGMTPETLLTRASVKDGRIILPDGMSYQILVLPSVATMTPQLLKKIRDLVNAGATVIGPRPLKSPSLSDYPRCDNEVKALADELWGKSGEAGSRRVGRGLVASLPSMTAPESEPQDPLANAKWIWTREGNPAQSAPPGARYFRRAITVDKDAKIDRARAFFSADNNFELWVNGQKAGGGNNFHFAPTLDIAALLKPGENVLAVKAVNGGETPNPAGLLGVVIIQYGDGRTAEINTDSTWQCARDVADSWTVDRSSKSNWQPAMELGPAGMAVWGPVNTRGPQPDFFCEYGVVTNALGRMGIPPDFESDGPVRYTHRRTPEAEIYFVANREEQPISATCVFRTNKGTPELWDPSSGAMRPLPQFKIKDGRTTVPMRFDRAQSYFVVFRSSGKKATSLAQNFPLAKWESELSGPWEVAFDPRWGGPEKVIFEELADWTKRSEPGIKYYSGTAVYRKTFDLPERGAGQKGNSRKKAKDAERICLDLGAVKNIAQVRLNGSELGTVWCAPWRIDVTDTIKHANNELEIRVVNLWPNRLIGDQLLPVDKQFTRTTWNPFTKDSALLPSGLLGPVRVTRESAN